MPAGTLAVTERLRREGAHAGAERRPSSGAAAVTSGGGVLRAEPPSELAVARVIDPPAGPLRSRVLRSGEVRACDLHLHGGGWALRGADRQDHKLSRFASAARLAVVSVLDAAPDAVVAALRDVLRERGITEYAVVDHGHDMAASGAPAYPAWTLIFGSPTGGAAARL